MEQMLMIRRGMSIFMHGNGPKAPLEELTGEMQGMIDTIKSVDKSKIKSEGNVNVIPKEYVEIAMCSNQAIEKFIGYAKRKDTNKEEVKALHQLLKEVVKVDCEVIGSSTTRLEYVEDLKVLIENKHKKVPVFLTDEELIEAFNAWFETFVDMVRFSDINVTAIDIIEGRDEIREKYQEEHDSKCEEYMIEVFKDEGIGIGNRSIFTQPSMMEKLSKKLNEFEKEEKMQYLKEATEKLNGKSKDEGGEVYPRRMRITPAQRVVEQLTKEEIIEEAEKHWKPLYEEGKFELGKAVVLFPSIEFNEVTYVFANPMPQPILVEFKKGWRKSYKEFKSFLEEQGLYIIDSNDSGHRKVSPEVEKDILQEVEKHMRRKRYN